MSTGEALALAYGAISVVVLLWAALIVSTPGVDYWTARRTAARVAFLCWAWPVLLVIVIVRGVVTLWRETGW